VGQVHIYLFFFFLFLSFIFFFFFLPFIPPCSRELSRGAELPAAGSCRELQLREHQLPAYCILREREREKRREKKEKRRKKGRREGKKKKKNLSYININKLFHSTSIKRLFKLCGHSFLRYLKKIIYIISF
jgi:hypothetical protein